MPRGKATADKEIAAAASVRPRVRACWVAKGAELVLSMRGRKMQLRK